MSALLALLSGGGGERTSRINYSARDIIDPEVPITGANDQRSTYFGYDTEYSDYGNGYIGVSAPRARGYTYDPFGNVTGSSDNTGVVSIYDQSLSLQRHIVPPSTGGNSGDWFGYQISMSDVRRYILISCAYDSKVFLYDFITGTLLKTFYVSGVVYDVALSPDGDTAYISVDQGTNKYILTYSRLSDTSWTQIQTKSSTTSGFGLRIAASNNYVAVASPSGQSWVYTRSGTSPFKTLNSGIGSDFNVGIGDIRILEGTHDVGNMTYDGIVAVSDPDYNGGEGRIVLNEFITGSSYQFIEPNNVNVNDRFGRSIDLIGNGWIWVGSRDNGGAVSAISLSNLIFRVAIVNPDPNDFPEWWAYSIAATPNTSTLTAYVGDPRSDYNPSVGNTDDFGLFRKVEWNGGTPITTNAYFDDRRFAMESQYFGSYGVASNDNYLVVGMPNRDGDGFNRTNMGTVSIYGNYQGSTVFLTELYFPIDENYPSSEGGALFGYSVDIDEHDNIVVGAPGVYDSTFSQKFGAVYTYVRTSGTTWALQDTIDASSFSFPSYMELDAQFGYSVACSSKNGALMVGAPGFNGNSGGTFLFKMSYTGNMTYVRFDSGNQQGYNVVISPDGSRGFSAFTANSGRYYSFSSGFLYDGQTLQNRVITHPEGFGSFGFNADFNYYSPSAELMNYWPSNSGETTTMFLSGDSEVFMYDVRNDTSAPVLVGTIPRPEGASLNFGVSIAAGSSKFAIGDSASGDEGTVFLYKIDHDEVTHEPKGYIPSEYIIQNNVYVDQEGFVDPEAGDPGLPDAFGNNLHITDGYTGDPNILFVSAPFNFVPYSGGVDTGTISAFEIYEEL